jgi:glycerophosphoryl diester phosphodiesterase
MTKLTAIFILFCTSTAFSQPLIISHRGASYWAPEESKPSYLLASQLGGDFWEMDIQRTRDGVLIAIHDLDLKRTTNVADVFPGREKNPVDSFTWAELQQLDLGPQFNKNFKARARPTFKNLKILSFEDVVKLAVETKYRGGLYVESKNPERYPGIEDQMITILKKYNWLDQDNKALHSLVFQSFGEESILVFKEKAPQIERTFLIEGKDFLNWKKDINFGIQNECTLGPDKLMFKMPSVKKALLSSGRPIHGWTVDSTKDLTQALQLNFAGVFTNRTDLAIQVLRKQPAPDIEKDFQAIGY